MIELKISGDIYGGWTDARVERGIERLSGSFALTVSERWPGQDEPRPIRRGERCEVLVDGETVITGWVDEASPSFGPDAHSIRICGRDTTGDLVDCSAIYKTGQWRNARLDKIATDLCGPFDIPVKADTDLGAVFTTYALQEGETVYEAIERACRLRAVLPMADGKGGLLLTRAGDGPPAAILEQGVNILAASGQFSNRERYSRYIIKGQDRGIDDGGAESHTQVRAESIDEAIWRYRPLIVLAESRGEHATYQQRADWERNVRQGRSSRATVTVLGWRVKPLGDLWRPNLMVQLRSPWLGVNAPLLVTAVAATYNEQNGSRTELELAGREAYDLIVGKGVAGVAGRIREKKSRSHHKAKGCGTDWSRF